jgi:hypothetical protein
MEWSSIQQKVRAPFSSRFVLHSAAGSCSIQQQVRAPFSSRFVLHSAAGSCSAVLRRPRDALRPDAISGAMVMARPDAAARSRGPSGRMRRWQRHGLCDRGCCSMACSNEVHAVLVGLDWQPPPLYDAVVVVQHCLLEPCVAVVTEDTRSLRVCFGADVW